MPISAPDRLIDTLRALLGSLRDAPIDLLPATDGEATTPLPTSLPVLGVLGAVQAQAPAAARPAVDALLAAAPMLAWRQTYKAGEADPAFLAGYGWTELVGPAGYRRDPDISAGLLLLGPGVYYPAHNHPALEHYVPLSGAAEWFDEHRGWRTVAPLTPIAHRPMVLHAMRTGDQPLLAYYIWTGRGVAAKARLAE